MIPIRSITKIQEEVFAGNIFSLKTNGVSYTCCNIGKSGLTRIPNGKWIYVVTVDNPFEIILISQDDMDGMLLKTNKIYLGHTSLAREFCDLKNTGKQNSYALERLKVANRRSRMPGQFYAKDVYLAGDMLFKFGVLQEWTNDSGHYRIQSYVIKYKIPSPLSKLLPMHLYKSV